ncbi:conserved glutamic acid rich protein [Colletotrichum tofieldiae]|nr:conserved glutamic acid rich protein [Colletotrichum tofieldiae]
MAYRSNDFEERTRRQRAESRVAFNDVDVRVKEREREREGDRLRFLRDERPPEAGALVLSRREVESRELSRPRQRSPSPVYRERIVRRARSLTPPHVHEQELERSRVRISEREREIRSPSRGPPPEIRARYVERQRSPSPPPPARERSRVGVRIVERERERERVPSPSPSPPPPPQPQVIRGPTIEREVITHYRDIDHGEYKQYQQEPRPRQGLTYSGVTRVPSPPPPPRPAPRPKTRTEERELDIDITTSRNRTDIDIHRSQSRHRSPSRERRSPAFQDHRDLVVSTDRLRIDDRHYHGGSRRRAHSAAARTPVDEEAEYITSKIDSRGKMGEAWNGATKDWAIVDVPPGTERVRMDGVGGGSAEVTWQRYNGVRRAKFIPERDGAPISAPAPLPEPSPRDSRDRLSLQVYDRETEIEIEKTKDRAPGRRQPTKRNEMWTEITKDLVIRDAIVELGYDFEETEYFFYIMQYLKYDDVLELVQVSDDIRRFRKDRVREYEREWVHDDWDRRSHHHHHRRGPSKYDDERVYEREVVYDSQRPRRW